MRDFKRLLHRFTAGRRDYKTISESGLFDPSYYLDRYPDVAKKNIDPLRHYLYYGRHEGRAPSADFDPEFYLRANPDVSQAQLDPFVHYVRYGHAERRPSHPLFSSARTVGGSPRQILLSSGLFDPEYYRTAYLDVAFSKQDPLLHYLSQGWQQHRRPSADFDPSFYLARCPDLQESNTDPLRHYIEHGKKEGRLGNFGMDRSQIAEAANQLGTSSFFEAEYYLERCPAVRAAGVDPVLHYLVGGLALFVNPSPNFSVVAYTRAHPEIAVSGVNPLIHFLNPGSYADAMRIASRKPCRSDDSAIHEIAAGEAYFKRFGFPPGPSNSLDGYISEAIADIGPHPAELTIDQITPDVSIIIPVFGQLHFALSCLDALRRHCSRFSVEIIVSDDVSPPASQVGRLAEISWIRYRRSETNLGFIDNCNEAAAMTHGRFLIFLNSDTRIVDGWLDELIGSFDLFPKAGLVGSALLNADGTLQEAGGIYWRDGSAWNYGRGDDPNHPKYCYARRVDYISGASIAVPVEVWRAMGGFDEMFRPAYCEDADLAFRIRQAGHEVWLQPVSQVIHYDGMSHGRSTKLGVKKFQEINMSRFAERWQDVLVDHRVNGNAPDKEANRNLSDRILVVDAVTPKPDRDSGSFITIRMLKALQELGHQITFIPQDNYDYEKTYTSSLQRLGIECLYKPYVREFTEALDHRDNFDFVLAYRGKVLDQVFNEIRQRMPSARIIFHNVDLHFLREEREAALSASRSMRIAAAETRAKELELFAKVDCSIVHTSVEAAIIKDYLPIENIIEFPYIAEVHPSAIEFNDRHDVMFLGGMNHRPNADAVRHFTSSIWPILSQQLPDRARLLIVGAAANAETLGLAGPRIVVTGWVPDLQPYFDSARVFIAPIRYGAGIKGKVIQSLCYGTPSVITPAASEGIGLVSGRDTIISSDDSSFIEGVLNLYTDSALWYSVQSAGYQFVEERFSWKRCLDLIGKALDTADEIWLERHNRASANRLRSIVSGSNESPTIGIPSGTKTWIEPGHFYSPLVNPKDPFVEKTFAEFSELELGENSGVTFDRDKMIDFFSHVSRRYDELPFVQRKQAPLHYYYDNPMFGSGDAIMLGLICMEFRPNRIVEVGSGFSSAAMIDLNERLFNGKVKLTFVEPYPEKLLKLLPSTSSYRGRIITEPVQSTGLDIFKQLEANDILFIDSSHVAKMASDVNHLVFNVFPVLKPGVLIHVHDIFYPFEYPSSWILNENRSWNEAYLLRAFLQFNNFFEVLFNNHFAVRKFPELLKTKTPLFMNDGGGSLWMQRSH